MKQFWLLSSTTRAFFTFLKTTGGLFSFACSTSSSRVKEKVLPLPGSLVRCNWSPIFPSKRFEIVNPSPVPPYFLVVDGSACIKDSKILCWLSGEIPIPESRTKKRKEPVPGFFKSFGADVELYLAFSVNLMALLSKFIMTWRSRNESTFTYWIISGGISSKSSRPCNVPCI